MAKPVPPQMTPHKSKRPREYLTYEEVARVLKAAASMGRFGARDYALILLMYRHGLRVGEAVRLKWDQVDLKEKTLQVQRLKNGISGIHPLTKVEVSALRDLAQTGPFIFDGPAGLALKENTMHHIVQQAGKKAGLAFSIHPHMLRHSCGFYLINRGIDIRTIQAYMGHKQIQNTVRYTELQHTRFKGLWKS